ncbi:hypothetical protein CHU92_06060 [Flavobacterium cyanobacteriorum]|uniref:Uncharacterized protein n=1 Tax=Flavobacterium cyanobacteriorum TaxID=2022802 RepID=A0A255Z9F7_9FLAO|nr:hypothetical protein [Flavobacterium cyanobacteriorum]OYQ38193.1 hypothetical protein CHU92_06060 [Flavobacterium cyanobacteriorum]
MKKILKHTRTATLCLVAVVSFSCSEEDPIASSVTNYPVIEIMGDDVIIVEKGQPFNDPGAIATIDGK